MLTKILSLKDKMLTTVIECNSTALVKLYDSSSIEDEDNISNGW